MPNERRMWIIRSPRGKLMWDTARTTRQRCFDALWSEIEDPHAREQAYRHAGYRAVRVLCVVEKVDGKDAT